jgi:hypothetical protein
MATKKPTTKATSTTKKHTINKSANRKSSARATAAKATTTKKETKETTVAKVKTSKVRKPADFTKQLRWLHISSAVVFTALAVAAGLLMKGVTFPLTIGYQAKDVLAESAGTVFAPATQSIFDIDLRWVLIAVLLLSVTGPLLYVTRLKAWYARAVQNESVPTRWLDLALTGALMVEVVALLSGVNNLFVLKAMAGAIVVTCALGWVAERQHALRDRGALSTYGISLLSGLLPWFVIVSAAVGTWVNGMVRSPWYVYALYAATFLGFSLIARLQWVHYRGKRQWTNFAAVERDYFVGNFLMKTAFAVILIVGLKG